MSVTVNISDAEIRQAVRKINYWTDEKRKAIKDIVAGTALAVETGAKKRAPVDTGRLRASIHHKIKASGLDADVETNVHYAAAQEFGTSTGVPAHPYMHPAAEAERPRFKRRIIEALRKMEAGI